MCMSANPLFKKTIWLLAAWSFCISAAWAQAGCWAEEWHQSIPGHDHRREQFEQWLHRAVAGSTGMRTDTVFTIPVIVHIVHNGEAPGNGRNISQAQVESQLEVLNEDFRRKAGTPGFNTDPVGADAGIEFCLALTAPDGTLLAEPGIHRVDRNAMGWPAFPYTPTYVTQNVLPPTIWDPERYLNIWVVDLEGGVLGFAQYPDSPLPGLGFPTPDSTDGVVVETNRFGRGGSALPPYNQGRTLTHEIGHFLGLRHTWGDGDCSVDDFCGDTPPSAMAHFGCPGSAFDCGVPVQLNNYLDYTDDVCMNLFTQCQAGRMRAVLRHAPRRAGLTVSTVCRTDLPPAASFIQNTRQVCPGNSVAFTSTSSFFADSLIWSFPGGVPTAATGTNVAVTYAQPGTYEVVLIAKNGFGADTAVLSGAVTVSAVSEVAFFDDFENGLGKWERENPDGALTWDVAATSGSRSGPAAARMRMYDYPQKGQRDGLISPAMDLTAFSQVKIRFDYAYRLYNLSSVDTLNVYVSGDSGATYTRIWSGAENGQGSFATAPPLTAGFIPNQVGDWCHDGQAEAVCLEWVWPAGLIGSKSRLKLETVNAYGNNLYIDGVTVEGFCSALGVEKPVSRAFAIRPNPATDRIWLDGPEGRLNIALLSPSGQVMAQWETLSRTEPLMLRNVPPGVYMLHIQGERKDTPGEWSKLIISPDY